MLHDLSLSRTLVVDATEVQDAMDDDAMELTLVGLVELLRIRAHGVEADDDVAGYLVAFGIIKGNDVGVIVVSQELAIASENTLVIDEFVADRTQSLAMKLGDLTNPGADVTAADGRHSDAFIEKRNCHW